MTRFRMGTLLRAALFAALATTATLATPTALQAATPEKGHLAVGGTLGLFVPYESDYKLGFALQGAMDYYFERRIAVRGTVAFARTESKSFDNPTATNAYLLGSGVYNWEMGAVHPYALAGVGLYAISPAYGGSTARVGVHVGGGVDYFVTRRTAIVGEGMFHFVGTVENQKQGFFAVNAGVRYFF